MRTIAINNYITATLTERSYRAYMDEVNYLRWEREAWEALQDLSKRLETASGQEAVELWGEYSDLHKALYGVRPH